MDSRPVAAYRRQAGNDKCFHLNAFRTSVANPKFAMPWSNSASEFRIQSHTSNLLISSVVLEFEVPKRGCHADLRNFKFTTLVVDNRDGDGHTIFVADDSGDVTLAGQVFGQIDAKLLSFAILGAVNWIPRWYNPDGPSSSQEIAECFADYLIGGLRRA